MIDGFGRKIDYLRISVTDRCNFRCHYCMPENQHFLSHQELLDYTELSLIADRFIDHGIQKIRLTGGEPLVRRDIGVLVDQLGKYVANGRLKELTMTTNGSRLEHHAEALARANIWRINVSIDSLNPKRFSDITRGGDLAQVLAGINAAKAAGINIKINMVALNGVNNDEILNMAHYCAAHGHDLALIETMPLGDGVSDRADHYIALDKFIAPLHQNYSLQPIDHQTAGPARYWQVKETGLRIGLITPLSNNFCDDCNRIRLTTDGKVYMCLGSDLHVDFRAAIRDEGISAVDRLLQKALKLKPERHDFERQMGDSTTRLHRHMNATGG
jgi:GTP 3',8-cyclase